jgi:hypothetical protein
MMHATQTAQPKRKREKSDPIRPMHRLAQSHPFLFPMLTMDPNAVQLI